MLKQLFTSQVRVKLLQTFVENPGEEFFIRQLTRDLGEQINSIRRELENLRKIGILESRPAQSRGGAGRPGDCLNGAC